ncbi:FecR family protein [Pedobacter montanisoli]|uniref:FecR family protein n=1 Tax=Pedobacter montanisoli TaxID=2923277 RepID=A0ABS9ZR86_9SPHI|nr:FecR family protein [Pedobacter montanisoli]MCJ0741100.1 FecR family protein [Pedobacter montanisoli]
MDTHKAKLILDKYRAGICSEEELALLESWYVDSQSADIDLISEHDLIAVKNDIWNTLPVHNEAETIPVKKIKLSTPFKYWVAAVALIILSVSIYLINHNDFMLKVNNKFAAAHIKPGSAKATLTLANGKTIVLDNANNGVIAGQNGASVIKTNGENLSYQRENNTSSVETINLLSVPAGGFYTLTLSDGTKVWLNSKSSLKYPTCFVGNERRVELTGEGYFEVAHNANQPFKVKTKGQVIEVLGTRFNINAYGDENSINTSLLQGSIKIWAQDIPAKVLSPGEKAILADNALSIQHSNVEDEIDWVNNDFIFNNSDLCSILRKISRWYNVEIDCPAELSNMKFSGKISRSKNIQQVLNIMELTGSVNFKIEERRITVMP